MRKGRVPDSARGLAARAFRDLLRPGDSAVDATLGKGRDCALLCDLVGETGTVYGFDVQQQALDSTRALLSSLGLASRAHLHLLGHERMAEVVPSGIRLAAFNLGWLPGADKGLTTRAETTVRALEAALALLTPGGMAVLCVYPGHAEGAREQEALLAFARGLSNRRFTALWHCFPNGGPGVPGCLMILKTGEDEDVRGTPSPGPPARNFVP